MSVLIYLDLYNIENQIEIDNILEYTDTNPKAKRSIYSKTNVIFSF